MIGCRRSTAGTGTPAAGSGFDLITNDFSTAVRDADYVCLLIPGSPANANFLDRDRIALLPERAWLINTARGTVVDEAALYDALAEGGLPAPPPTYTRVSRTSRSTRQGPAHARQRDSAAARRQQHGGGQPPHVRARPAQRGTRRRRPCQRIWTCSIPKFSRGSGLFSTESAFSGPGLPGKTRPQNPRFCGKQTRPPRGNFFPAAGLVPYRLPKGGLEPGSAASQAETGTLRLDSFIPLASRFALEDARALGGPDLAAGEPRPRHDRG